MGRAEVDKCIVGMVRTGKIVVFRHLRSTLPTVVVVIGRYMMTSLAKFQAGAFLMSQKTS